MLPTINSRIDSDYSFLNNHSKKEIQKNSKIDVENNRLL